MTPASVERKRTCAPATPAARDTTGRHERARDRWRRLPRSQGLFAPFRDPWFNIDDWWFDTTGVLHGHFHGSQQHQGYHGMVHGGVIAALADTAMTHCLFGHDICAFTAELLVRYRRPLETDKPAEVSTCIDDTSFGQLYLLTTTICQDGLVRAEATAKFFRPDAPDTPTNQTGTTAAGPTA